MLGNTLAASGGIEVVGSILQMQHHFVNSNLNAYPLNKEVASSIPVDKIPNTSTEHSINYLTKASYGFGDVNAYVVLKNLQN